MLNEVKCNRELTGFAKKNAPLMMNKPDRLECSAILIQSSVELSPASFPLIFGRQAGAYMLKLRSNQRTEGADADVPSWHHIDLRLLKSKRMFPMALSAQQETPADQEQPVSFLINNSSMGVCICEMKSTDEISFPRKQNQLRNRGSARPTNKMLLLHIDLSVSVTLLSKNLQADSFDSAFSLLYYPGILYPASKQQQQQAGFHQSICKFWRWMKNKYPTNKSLRKIYLFHF
ncbi:hypothetical protein T07_8378 [Trichinella nelsoni]|uniref:Uncharacterized protein n=1 Tax=Trichinella nelsoni TaxID=6336 RepID=A0A0V0SKD3_9BILA|nr:hypothetical protein T07_8378 [Trichinella nelsoni]